MNTTEIFSRLGINCTSGSSRQKWSKTYHPAVHLRDSTCHGYVGVPNLVPCKSEEQMADPDLRRLCRCQNKGWLTLFPVPVGLMHRT